MCARAPRERRTSENSVKAKFVERHHSEGKRCMLASLKSGADFSKGCAGRRIGHLIFATHPYRLTPRGMTRGDTTTLCTGLGSCWIVKTEFGERPFHALGCIKSGRLPKEPPPSQRTWFPTVPRRPPAHSGSLAAPRLCY